MEAGVVRAWSQSKTVDTGPDGKPIAFPYHPGARLVFCDGTPDVLAYPRDRKGWGNLCRLLTQANLRDESPKGAPLVHLADLLEFGDCMSLAVLPDLEADTDEILAVLQGLVGRFGMRRLSHGALLGFLAINALWLALTLASKDHHLPFAVFIVLFALAMFQFGWIGSNFNSLAMEPLGHVAGTASSVLGFMGTAGGTVIGAIIGQSFNGTSLPLVIGFFTLSVIGLIFVLIAEHGKLFQPHNKPV